MKKLTATLLALILLISCVCLSGCGIIFDIFDNLLFGDGNSFDDIFSDHTHQYESYFRYSRCQVDGCSVIGRKGSESNFSKEFAYTLTNAKIAQIERTYEQILTHLQDSDDYAQFEQLYRQYVDDYNYVLLQYQVAYVLYDVERSTTNVNNYATATRLRNEMQADYYGLYELIYNSDLRNDFYQDWSEEEIYTALYYAEIYGDAADNNNAVDDVLSDYDDYLNQIGGRISNPQQLNVLSEMYGRLVDANNNVAKASYYDNFMDYAYAEVYNRDYEPSQVAETMRAYVKSYVAPIFVKVAMRNKALYDVNFNSTADSNFYFALMSDSLFTPKSSFTFNRAATAVNYVADYLDYLFRPSTFTGGVSVDFGAAVEDVFKNGNYFTGEYEGAYTWWINSLNTPIMYFGDGYDTAFTFVHEFGHYYESVYNGNLTLSYDHEETHSQGNEMLFLAWLAQNKASGVTNGYDMVEMDQLFDMLGNIVIATAVDEFEQAAYTGIYNGEPISPYLSYHELFEQILSTYNGVYNNKVYTAADFLNTNYWAYVVFDSAAYYISYAMSALPSLELYVKAKLDGLYDARDCYVKLFTFANTFRFVTNDSYGNAHLRNGVTYQDILNYSGLQGPFELGLYTDLTSYFNSRSDL